MSLRNKFSLFLTAYFTLSTAITLFPEISSSTALGATQGPWFGSELRSRASFGNHDVPLRVTWVVKPAPGNCNITLLSLYNGDRIFTHRQGHWSEIGFEIYGGAYKQYGYDAFQTQYITYDQITDPALKRGREHAVQHKIGGLVADLWDGRFHEFVIEWKPSPGDASYISFRVDGIEIRRERGGDVARLEEQLEAYAGLWISNLDGPQSWGCSDRQDRLESSAALMDEFRVDQWLGDHWDNLVHRKFDTPDETQMTFDRSSWGFETFDGSYCEANVVAQDDSIVRLELDKNCGPDQGYISFEALPAIL